MIQINELSFSYKKGEPLFQGLNLELHPGHVYGLFGLNGVGKTTLLNIMAGMLFPDAGTCTLDQQETKLRSPEVLSQLFVVPEQFEYPDITGQKYVQLNKPFYPLFDENTFNQVIQDFEIDVTKNLQKLSFGQQKKFLIAFAIATNTRLLLLDEPTNGLDIPSKSQFRRTFASLDTEGRCILISTHQVRDLGSMIDHVTILKDSEIVVNDALSKIQSKISTRRVDKSSIDGALYAEEVLGGMNVIFKAVNENEGDLDLELLFNGIVYKTGELQEVLI